MSHNPNDRGEMKRKIAALQARINKPHRDRKLQIKREQIQKKS